MELPYVAGIWELGELRQNTPTHTQKISIQVDKFSFHVIFRIPLLRMKLYAPSTPPRGFFLPKWKVVWAGVLCYSISLCFQTKKR